MPNFFSLKFTLIVESCSLSLISESKCSNWKSLIMTLFISPDFQGAAEHPDCAGCNGNMVSRQQVQHWRWPNGHAAGVHEISERLYQGEMWLCPPFLVSVQMSNTTLCFLLTYLFERPSPPLTFLSLFSLSEGIIFIAAGEELPTWEEFALLQRGVGSMR